MFNRTLAAARMNLALQKAHQEEPIETAKDFAEFLKQYGADVIEADKEQEARIAKARENAAKADKKKASAKKGTRGRRRRTG